MPAPPLPAPTATSRPTRVPGAGPATLGGSLAMTAVGGSVAVSGLLAGGPLLTGQALRYAVACLLLVAVVRARGQRVVRPRGREWLWLLGVTGAGLVVFNLALVAGSAHAEPAVLGVAVACVPLLLAVVGPLLEGRRPLPVVLLAAGVVTAGAALVEGFGRTDGTGLVWALVVLACEAGFTLLAVPVLGRLGPQGVSVHTTWLAALAFAALGLQQEGATAVTRLTGADLLALAFLAVAVTALAFVLWYGAVRTLGAGRAGLLTGIAPIAAAVAGVVLGGPVPHPSVLLGVAVVGGGLALGLSARPPATGPAETVLAPQGITGSASSSCVNASHSAA
ncbi:DMT family transporter [Modestobacter sp. NPDC049651]|uniref:DMT family transporter n=1 Tax=unclassified Modestobacter TaxID=2643866 RepID=UPI0033DAAF60